ncbi:polygalacturonase-like [Cucurbita pepo subsp. pepo]|uniref:polygalacturonase-like n=1 Tax=Cucurbita pepo subsp. pepo TaxID=3664 RepID=UPI000C9D6EAF|nr:polygalacturonase-like [Cucurbita pepo subsp. pepo]XP_023528797.1 polygalacturonase-like [Cucurbita pepo subsp. pepo]
MHQPTHFLIFFMSFPLFSLCFGSFHVYPLPVSQYHDQIYGHYPKPRWNTGFYGSMTRQDRVSSLSGSPKIVNVVDFGAKGNGQDDSKAFELAWKEACSSSKAMILVPKGRTYYLKPITFSGPCRSPLTLKIDGMIKASPRMSDYDDDRRHWLKFEGVDNFVVEGNGIINGNGKKWWQNSCKVNKELPCRGAPTAVTFYQCINLVVANLKLENAQQMHLTFQKCTNVQALNLRVVAPENSPNTDGIHVTETQNVIIRNCVIGTGDDCISIVSGSRNVRAMDITCGPGHGISIGSLGAGNSEAEVSNIRVDRALISGTSNGVRIKTWQGGSGYAKNIMFQNVVMNNVSNPIIIDQNYCDKEEKSCPQQNSAVKVSNVVYKNIRGTSASDDAIRFDCSKSSPCQDISMLGVHLVRQGDDVATASCENVRLKNRWKVYPQCSS